jgi:hypothetical protein
MLSPATRFRKQILTRKRFTEEEDNRLREIVRTRGESNWVDIAVDMPGRTGRQCRDRFKNYLTDDVTADAWTPNEDAFLLREFRRLGPRWSLIAARLKGRSPIHVKNRWYKHLARCDETSPFERTSVEEERAFNWEEIVTTACNESRAELCTAEWWF